MKFVVLTKVKLKRKLLLTFIVMCAVYLVIYYKYKEVIYFSVKIGREIVCKTFEDSPLNSGSNADKILKSPPAILEIKFGLGNQLFQYAASYSIARRRNSDLYICLRKEDVPLNQNESKSMNSNPWDRSYGLGRFKIPQDKLLIKPIRSNVTCESLIFGQNIPSFSANDEAVVKCAIPADRIVKINGYFESEIFFHEYKEELMKMFVLDNEEAMKKDTEVFLRLIEETESVCVHVRRRDFENDKSRILPHSYYLDAMTLMEQKLSETPSLGLNRTFFVFSDDITNVMQDFESTINRDKSHDVVFVSNGNFSRYHDLFLMIKCKHLIMSNSTFSWWAAYLNMHKDKIVIAPLPKFKETYNYWNHPYSELVKKFQYYWSYPTSYTVIQPKFD